MLINTQSEHSDGGFEADSCIVHLSPSQLLPWKTTLVFSLSTPRSYKLSIIIAEMSSPNSQPSLIAPIRTASRLMIRELGFMSSTSARTDYSPSAVHALIELGSSSTPLTASALSQMLNLDKSSVSRMVKKLVLADEIEEGWSEGDTVYLCLP